MNTSRIVVPELPWQRTKTWFHGCMRGAYGYTDVGHFLFREGEHRPRRVRRIGDDHLEQPWRNGSYDGLDGTLAPRPSRRAEAPQGHAALHHKDGWTALAFWDRTGDRRGNSNSVFLFDAHLTFEQAVQLAEERWPELFARFDFEVVAYGG